MSPSLAGANRVRLAQAQLHRDIVALPYPTDRHFVADLLCAAESRDEFERLRVRVLLGWIRHFGSGHVDAVCDDVGVHGADRRVRDLTARQRDELSLVLRLPVTVRRDAA